LANKEKLIASAQKFLSKGQIPKAIGEYQKLVQAFPKDVRNRQKLAELFSRDKRHEEALAEYEAVARHYTETGFYLKSIAVFKQMQKIEPSRVDIYHHLAELNEKQGLVGNALTEYRNLVSFYDKNEMHNEAIEVLEKMVVLDPDNLNFSAKIAECFMACGKNEEAFEKFQSIIESLVEKNEFSKIVKLYERFLDLCPEDGTSRLPFATALLKSGSFDKAIHVLKGLLKHSPENPDVNLCLTDAYVANKDFANARLTLKHLLKQKEGDLDLCEYYVRICLEAGEVERARDRLEEWKDAFFQAERITVLQSFYQEIKKLLPEDSKVAGTLSVIYEAVGDTQKLNNLNVSADVSVETDVTSDAALIDRAIDDIETLEMVGEEADFDIEVPPLAVDASAKKQFAEKNAAVGLELDLDLDLETTVTEPDSEEAKVPATVAEADGDVEIEIEIDLDDMDEFALEFDEEIPADESGSSEQAFIDGEEAKSADEVVSEDEISESELELEFVSEPPVFDQSEEANTVEDSQCQDDNKEPCLADMAEALDVNMSEAPRFDTYEPLQNPENRESPEDSEENENFANLEEVEGTAEFEQLEELVASEEIEEVEDVEQLEELDELEELEELEELDELEELHELEEIEELEALDEVEAAADEETSDEMGFAAALNIEAELEEAEFYLQQGLYDDAERVIQTLMEYRPDLPELQAKSGEINQRRHAAENESESSDFADFISDLHDDDLLSATNFLDAFGSAAQENDELSQKLVSELDSSDTESHYNLGIAYKEMGLYDDAIVEFEKAAKDPSRHLDCTTLTGQCYLETGETDAAMEAFKRGLAHEGLNNEGRMTLNFEIGMLHQLNGQLLDALEYFQLVAEKDSFFRDVSELIKNLRRELGLDVDCNDDGGPRGNRDRVSYV